MLNSCLYEGKVRHRRFLPTEHTFQYRLFFLFVDLSELDVLFNRFGLWSTRGPTLAWFRRADYVGNPARPLADCVRELIQERTGRHASGPIRLLTSFRYFGWAMNPVSLYYCFDASGCQLETVVAEVNNTPWNEKYCYVLDLAADHSLRTAHLPTTDGVNRPQHDDSPVEYADFAADKQSAELPVTTAQELTTSAHRLTTVRQPKCFHVSPFLPMDMTYTWKLSQPDQQLIVHIENRQRQVPSEKTFDATLMLTRRHLSRWNLARMMIQYPLLTARITCGIYWQALRLWQKGIPFIPHPRHASTSPLSS